MNIMLFAEIVILPSIKMYLRKVAAEEVGLIKTNHYLTSWF